MNFKKPLLALVTLLSFSFECPAYDGQGIFGVENPFFFTAFYDYVGPAEFKDQPFKGDKLNFNWGTAELASFVYFNECYKEGIAIGLNYTHSHLGWEENPRFDEENFSSAGVTINAFSGRLNDWMFKGFIKYMLDTNHPDFNHYSLWDIGAYGSYNYCEGLSLDFGFYAETGMKVDRVWPVIGFIWQYSDCISIHAVFPQDLNVIYQINNCWSAGVGIQFFRVRNRIGHAETLSRAIWLYENTGINGSITYEMSQLTYFSLHAGYTIGGRLKIADRHYDEKHHFKFKSAPYIGGELAVKF
jgi:hypothetical protein